MAEGKSKSEKKYSEKSLAEKYNEILSNKENFKVTPKHVNALAPIWFIVTMFCTFYLGQFCVAPVVHASYELSASTEYVLYGISYWAFAQLVMNWYCIRNVGSIYRNTARVVEKNDNHVHISEVNGSNKGQNYATKDRSEENEKSLENNDGENAGSLVWKRSRGDGQIYAVKMPASGANNPDHGHSVGLCPEQPVMYSYWSWKPCLICQYNVPPRTHHCPLCKACILKRDHHCYFTGRCIGLNNQRHFIVFAFWAFFACTLSVIYTLFYTYIMISHLGQLSWTDILVPVTFVRWCLGYTGFYHVILYFVVNNLAFFMIVTFRYVKFQLIFIRKGVTAFEYDYRIKIQNTNSFHKELKSVFGDHWYLNFIFPCHNIFPLRQNALDWPNIKQ
ncbi:unnamed protein product [Owenia fusiformis]|uniref:Palmitoyltransferase n=1 Tax=Owenia fusiformis TaxID=6347 RepID=A0A8S4NMT4_OWEFU|nr:unnamed protein product [Owenia fusiformis]